MLSCLRLNVENWMMWSARIGTACLFGILLLVPNPRADAQKQAATDTKNNATPLPFRIELPPKFDLSPTPPKLNEAQQRRLGVWMVHLGMNDKRETMTLLPMIDALINHPANWAYRPKNTAEASLLLECAN